MQQGAYSSETLARILHSTIMEYARSMEMIGELPSRYCQLPNGMWLWSRAEQQFLKDARNKFAHSDAHFSDAGTVYLYDRRSSSKNRVFHEIVLEELLEDAARVEELCNRLEVVCEVRVICKTCSSVANGADLLSCGHVSYGGDLSQPAIAHKPIGADLTVALVVGRAGTIPVENGRFRLTITYQGRAQIYQRMSKGGVVAAMNYITHIGLGDMVGEGDLRLRTDLSHSVATAFRKEQE